MQGADKGIEQELDGLGLHIGIVQARFNEGITNALAVACIRELEDLGVHDIDHVLVPGALEVPIALQAMAERGEYDALVALGCIIRGETYHFEVVSNDSCRAVMEVQLATGVPIANGILTTENDDQALVRMHGKGADCARCAVEMARLHASIRAGDKPQPARG